MRASAAPSSASAGHGAWTRLSPRSGGGGGVVRRCSLSNWPASGGTTCAQAGLASDCSDANPRKAIKRVWFIKSVPRSAVRWRLDKKKAGGKCRRSHGSASALQLDCAQSALAPCPVRTTAANPSVRLLPESGFWTISDRGRETLVTCGTCRPEPRQGRHTDGGGTQSHCGAHEKARARRA